MLTGHSFLLLPGDREVLDDILEAVEQASAEAEPAPAPAPPADHEQEDGDRIIDVMIERLLQEQNERMGEPRRESVDHGSGGEGLHSPRRDGKSYLCVCVCVLEDYLTRRKSPSLFYHETLYDKLEIK